MTPEVRRYAALVKAKRILQHALDATKAEMTSLEEEILEQFAQSGTQSVKVDKLNIHMRKAVYARRFQRAGEDDVKAWARLCEALRATGHGDIIKTKPHPQTLASLAKEYLEEDGAIPEEWRGAIKVFEVYNLGATSV